MKRNTLAKAKSLMFLCVLLTITISISIAAADTGEDLLNTAAQFDGKSNPRPSEECKGFVRYVYKEALDVEIPSTSGNNAEWNDYEQYGFRQVASFRPELIRSFNPNDIGSKEYFFKEFAFTLSKGDAIQMDGKNNPHSMIYVSTDTINGQPSGFLVIDANWNLDNVVHFRNVSFDDLWNYMDGLSSNGMRAYRYTGR